MSFYTKDRKCNKCSHIWEVFKARVNDKWPEEPCPACGENDSYIMMSVRSTEVAEGICGNAKNGYTSGVFSHPSSYGKQSTLGSK